MKHSLFFFCFFFSMGMVIFFPHPVMVLIYLNVSGRGCGDGKNNPSRAELFWRSMCIYICILYHFSVCWNSVVDETIYEDGSLLVSLFWWVHLLIVVTSMHDDIMKWKIFPCYLPFVREIHWSPVNSQHKGQWCGALMFSLICAWINSWVNNSEAGDSKRHHAHYDVTVMDMPHLMVYLQVRLQTSPITQTQSAEIISPLLVRWFRRGLYELWLFQDLWLSVPILAGLNSFLCRPSEL